MQTPIPFTQVISVLEGLKKIRRAGLEKAHFKNDDIQFLLKITYDLTDKDFEYFIAYILEKDGFSAKVIGGMNDGGIDLIASKNGETIFVQCKQWASSYITIKKAGEFYGSLYKTIKKNPGVAIAYVTTSYIDDDALGFLKDHGIDGAISNKKLIDRAKELGLFESDGWNNLIRYIRSNRLISIRNQKQQSIPSVYDELKKLRNARIYELRNHLPKYMQKAYIDFNNISLSESKFFQYWDLV